MNRHSEFIKSNGSPLFGRLKGFGWLACTIPVSITRKHGIFYFFIFLDFIDHLYFTSQVDVSSYLEIKV